MNSIFSLIVIILSLYPASSIPKSELISSSSRPVDETLPPYTAIIGKIDSLKQVGRKQSAAQAGWLLASYIDEKIIPYWIGTPWDYNGTTQKPKAGFIACGYFVTTVLRDAGVKINRVKMAQCASEQMINTLTTVKVNYSSRSFNEFIHQVKSKGPGLSIIGLDNHTGFLYNDGQELFFIHSSFVGTGKVVKELAADNGILQQSSYKVVGYISKDKRFIQSWLY